MNTTFTPEGLRSKSTNELHAIFREATATMRSSTSDKRSQEQARTTMENVRLALEARASSPTP